MKVTLVQLNSTDDIQKNVENIKEIIGSHLQNESQQKSKSKLFILPENSLFFRLVEGGEIQALELNSDAIKILERFAVEHLIYIHFTTAMMDSGVVFNASVLISPEGVSKIVYKKIHLFDIQLEGQTPVRESDFFQNGLEVTSFQIDDFVFGSSICYDLRFSELYSKHAKNKVDVILIPAAFLVKTGQAHWEVLTRARAIEAQAYVLAPGQVGVHATLDAKHSRSTYGHSIAINPWGEVMYCQPSGVGCFDVFLEKNKVESVRRQIPMVKHRRL